MSLLVWNCRGLGGPWTIRTLGDLIRANNPSLVFLAETKCASRQIEVLKRKFELNGVCVPSVGKSGGLVVFWDKSVNVQLQSYSQNHIDLSVQLEEGQPYWRFTGIYGEPESSKRISTWHLLHRLHAQSQRAWICAGDYNEILDNSEKLGGPLRPNWLMRNFRNALVDCELHDIGCMGDPFTWSNRHIYPHTVSERLDRACANLDWSHLFPDASVSHIPVACSDHKAVVVQLRDRPVQTQQWSRPWRFEAAWLQSKQCEQVVENSWIRGGDVSRLTGIAEKLTICQDTLRGWSSTVFRGTKGRVKSLKNRLQRLLASRITPAVQEEISLVRKEVEGWAAREETKWRQRCKDEDGEWVETEEGIRNCIISHFQKVYASSRPNRDDIARGTTCLRRVVDASMAEDLVRPYTAEEVSKALFQMAPLKSPGPDGMPPIFFHKFWHIVNRDVIVCVLNLLNSFVMPPGMNSTHLVLIPKCKHPEALSQFRPISLCNVVYKIASKTIANRLKVFLDKIISPVQSAFVPGRLITDNILLAFELNHFLNSKSKGGKGWMALKLDVSKAYDKVEWSFLEQVMVKLGFPPSFIRLIMLCISSVSFSFMLSGKQFGSLIPERGLRQGDPLSPYLFLMCTESFSSLLQLAEREGRIQGVSVCRAAPSISHPLFADDTLIFYRASSESTQAVLDILEVYRKASGQEINFAKSSVAFSKSTREDLCSSIVTALTIRRENKMELYLGLPSKVARSKKELFSTIWDRIWKKISGWNAKLLSQAGREVLIKAVLQAIPTYAMGCFRLPVTLLREIQSMISNFWWSNGGQHKIHWVAWQRLCESKLAGGMGFRQLRLFNLAMLAKQLWSIWRFPDRLLSRVLRARYFPSGDILTATLGTRPSFTWRSLMAAQYLFRAGSPSNLDHLRVADLIDPETLDWNVDLVQQLFWPLDSSIILTIPISFHGEEDLMVWHYSRNGYFSVRSAYHLAMTIEDRPCSSDCGVKVSQWWRKVWQARVPNKVKVFVWRACLNALPTGSNLNKRMGGLHAVCPFCHDETEDIIHVLAGCTFARQVWGLASLGADLSHRPNQGVIEWMQAGASQINSQRFGMFLCVCWVIWWFRNQLAMDGTRVEPAQASVFAAQYLDSYLSQVDASAWHVCSNSTAAWIAPSTDCIKINFDGVVFVAEGAIGVGIVARDSQGRCIAWLSHRVIRAGSGEMAEAWAAREAIQLAVRKGWRKVVIEGDCAPLIKKLADIIRDSSSLDPVVADILKYADNFHLCLFSWVKPSGNAVAHHLAQSAVSREEGISVVSPTILDLLSADFQLQ
ncbi:UNVERIFIED_CONTAM: putative mitochondrial protein [Sesamum calycinum]|uniref:Mitochondrial protein n=1 Tax=Sesamum calycinum TaxID=2727403 RepID=A0AAW2PRL7_9LAMI